MSKSNDPNLRGATIGQRIDEALELIQMELRHAVAYMNDSVVPQVRRESIQGLRTAADTLRNLADRFERHAGAASASGSQTGGSSKKPSGEPRS